MITIECKDDAGFEDQLERHLMYEVKEFGPNDYLIENDNYESRWYGAHRFQIVA